MFSFLCFGQDELISPEVKTLLTVIAPFMEMYIIKYPLLGKVMGYMLTARLIIKPLMSALMTISTGVEISFLKKVGKFSGSKIYKIIAFILDWVFSLKLPQADSKK
jgi:hypothetical protein